MQLEDKTALITGAASGFGKAMAIRFADEGAQVVILDQNISAAMNVVSQINNNLQQEVACAYECDVSNQSEVSRVVGDCISTYSRIDIVINNAGWSHKNQPLLETSVVDFHRVYEINVFSIFYMCHAIVPHWRQTGSGTMINISSTAGIRPRPGLTWYNSTKGAVNIMTKSLAVELAKDNIRVCGLAPVIGETGLTETFMGVPDTPENRQRFLDTIPLGRFSAPDDIANAALFLATDKASFITGSILEIDGGRCI